MNFPSEISRPFRRYARASTGSLECSTALYPPILLLRTIAQVFVTEVLRKQEHWLTQANVPSDIVEGGGLYEPEAPSVTRHLFCIIPVPSQLIGNTYRPEFWFIPRLWY